MLQTLVISGMLAGGLGLFLLAVGMITDGLKQAAGRSLRDLLSGWTRSPLHGIFTGLAITAVVQSSSAVTVATIGFVNAGLITMRRALGIVYGSNIGTTMTGWLVAIIGFKINVDAFALPLIGVGMILRLTGSGGRLAPLGWALAGFGLFFIGIDVLKDAFDGLAEAIDLTRLTVEGFGGVLIFVGVGFLMTVLTQSSSAAIAITLTAATGGVLDINSAAAMVIGANLGTTSTAALAVIGATSNAKRVATAHILFNAGTGLVALLILPVLFWIVQQSGELLGLADNPAITLALFHTVFNVLGVILMFPLNSRLAVFLEKRFVTQEEIEGQPRYLDQTVAVSPSLAINALLLEMPRLADIARRMGLAAISQERGRVQGLAGDEAVLQKLSTAVSDFISRLERGTLSSEVARQLAGILRAEQHLLALAEQAVLFANAEAELGEISDQSLQQGISRYHALVAKIISLGNPADGDFTFDEYQQLLDGIEAEYDGLKETLLEAGTSLRVPIPVMIEVIDQNGRLRQMARQVTRAMYHLHRVSLGLDSSQETAEADAISDPAEGDARRELPRA